MRDNYLQDWNSEIENSSRATTYRLCRFRVSAHRLAVEVGRWHKPNKIPYNERKCQLCNTLEDEFHFYLNIRYIMTLEKH